MGSILRRETDFLRDFAYPLPVQVICELLGVPAGGSRRVQDLVRRPRPRTADHDGHAGDRAKGNVAAASLGEYFRALIDDRRASPRDGFLDDLIAAEYQGGSLSEDELLATVGLLFFAGHETTVNLMGNGLVAMLRAPSQWAALRADPAWRAPRSRRCSGSTPRSSGSAGSCSRTSRSPASSLAGEMVNVIIAGANRDPAQFHDPDSFMIGRADGA